jgi:hypothetical protein
LGGKNPALIFVRLALSLPKRRVELAEALRYSKRHTKLAEAPC